MDIPIWTLAVPLQPNNNQIATEDIPIKWKNQHKWKDHNVAIPDCLTHSTPPPPQTPTNKMQHHRQETS